MISDQSDHGAIEKDLTAQSRFELRLVKRAREGEKPTPLLTDIERAIATWEASGNHCDIAGAHTVHMVVEGECAGCHTVVREFQHDRYLRIKVPQDLDKDNIFTLQDAVNTFFEARSEPKDLCPCCDQAVENLQRAVQETSGLKWTSASARIVNAPELLAFAVDRVHYEHQSDGSVEEGRRTG